VSQFGNEREYMADTRVALLTGAARSPITGALCAKMMARGWQVAGLDTMPSDATMSVEVDINDAGAVAQAVAEV
jgi:NAD(P)-dependent dehydrogenase (short-subunit alcohol dehydrogenase family)